MVVALLDALLSTLYPLLAVLDARRGACRRRRRLTLLEPARFRLALGAREILAPLDRTL